jgi:dimethylsulfide dehydrogenase subunit gamma
MNKLLLLILLAAVVGCGQTEVDATPVISLAIGESASLLSDPSGDFSNPDSSDWRDAQAYSIELSPAPPVHASINLRLDATSPPVPVHMRAATDGERYYLRLRWMDDSESQVTSRNEFADGIAVQFALQAGTDTSFMMGGPGAPVNIWYWKAGQDQPQNLAAGGFGSTTQLPTGNLQASRHYRENEGWTVVLSRLIATSEELQVDLSGKSIMLSLAVWQGDTRQRDGLKHVTMGWVTVNRG